jgi:glycosyltransferase involved in cell wall biosynthesis
LGAEGRPRAVFLAPESPFPPSGGGALRSASLLHYLARNYDVDLIVFRQPDSADPSREIPPGLCRRVSVINLPVHRRDPTARHMRNAIRLARRVPPLVDRFSGFGEAVTAELGGERYQIGVIEHFWCVRYWEQLAPLCARTVLDLHNIESVLHARCGEVETGAAGFAHRRFGQVALAMERDWLPRFSEILTTSPEDAELALARAPEARITVYPNAIPFPALPAAGDDNAVVFSGNLEYFPNIVAVRFFREHIWPRLRDRWPGLVWRLVGKNAEAVKRWTVSDERIEIRGPVENAIEELARARVAVAPILAASGTRLKILEAWGAVLPVVSTRIGAEGLSAVDGEHLLLADGAADFAEAVSRLLGCRNLRQKIAHAGRLLLETQFTWESAWKKLRL